MSDPFLSWFLYRMSSRGRLYVYTCALSLQRHTQGTVLPAVDVFGTFLRLRWLQVHGLVWDISSVHWPMCVFTPVPYCICYNSSVLCLEMWLCDASSLSFSSRFLWLFRNFFAYMWILRLICLVLWRTSLVFQWELYWICKLLCIIWIFLTVLILPIHENVRSFQFFVSSISFISLKVFFGSYYEWDYF